MKTITCSVQDEIIKASANIAGVAGSYNAVTLEIIFNSAWDDMSKKVCFTDAQGAESVYILLGPSHLKPNTTNTYLVPIPAEPLVYEGDMTMTIKGFVVEGEDETFVQLTVPKKFKVYDSSYDDGATAPDELTPTQAEQLQAQIDAAVRLISIVGSENILTVVQALEMLKVSNKNLLYNWDFRNPVNQRGQSSYNSGYSVDRWQIENVTLVVGDGYISVPTGGVFLQMLDESQMKRLLGKTVTLSLEGSDGVIISGSVTLPVTLPSIFDGYYAYNFGGVLITCTLGPSGVHAHFQGMRIYNQSGNALNIARVKLELGSVSTLAYDPPADFGEELRKCQRYYETSYYYGDVPGAAIGGSPAAFIAESTRYAIGNASFKVEKRVTPTITIYSATHGTINKPNDFTSGSDIAGSMTNFYFGSKGIFGIGNPSSPPFTQGVGYAFHWVASAEL